MSFHDTSEWTIRTVVISYKANGRRGAGFPPIEQIFLQSGSTSSKQARPSRSLLLKKPFSSIMRIRMHACKEAHVLQLMHIYI